MSESTQHLELRTTLYLVLGLEFEGIATIGSRQLLFWDRATSRKSRPPDALVRLSQPTARTRSWKTLEHGTPDVAVEIFDLHDDTERAACELLCLYQQSGVSEVVFFDPHRSARALRIWTRRGGM